MKTNFLKILILPASLIATVQAAWADEPVQTTEVAVQTAKIVKADLQSYVMAYGMVEPEPGMGGKPAASSKIAAPIAGIIAKIHCQEGQQVNSGDLLFELDARSTDALIAKAKVAVEFAQKNFARKKQLKASDNVSRKLYDEAEQLLETAREDLRNAKTQRDLLQIRAPLSATMASIHFKIGEAVNLNTVLAELIDLERLDIAIKIPSREANNIQYGQRVEISTVSKGEENREDLPVIPAGKVVFISPQVDSLTDTVQVRATLHRQSGLRPGQFVYVRILIDQHQSRLAVPIESLVSKENTSVIAVVENNTAKQHAVKPGLRDGNLVEVEGENIHEGMTVVTQGAYGLPAETRIKTDR